MLKFLLIFVTCLMVLFTVELLNPVQAAVIQPFHGCVSVAWVGSIRRTALGRHRDQQRAGFARLSVRVRRFH